MVNPVINKVTKKPQTKTTTTTKKVISRIKRKSIDKKPVPQKSKTINLKTKPKTPVIEEVEDIDFSQEIDIELGEEVPECDSTPATTTEEVDEEESGSEEEVEEIIEEIVEEEVTDDEAEEEVEEEEEEFEEESDEAEDEDDLAVDKEEEEESEEESDDEVVIKLVKKKSGKVISVDTKALKSLTSKKSKGM